MLQLILATSVLLGVPATRPAELADLSSKERGTWRRYAPKVQRQFMLSGGQWRLVPPEAVELLVKLAGKWVEDYEAEVSRLERGLAASAKAPKRRGVVVRSTADWKRRLTETKSRARRLKAWAARPGMRPLPADCIPGLGPPTLGNVGRVHTTARITQLVGGEAIAKLRRLGKEYDVWLRGWPLAGASDGSAVKLTGCAWLPETHTYTTVMGGARTLPVLSPFDLDSWSDGIPEAEFCKVLAKRGMSPRDFLSAAETESKTNPRSWARSLAVELCKAEPRSAATRPVSSEAK